MDRRSSMRRSFLAAAAAWPALAWAGAARAQAQAKVRRIGLLSACSPAEARAGQTLVSQRVFDAIEELVQAESAGELELKGFHRPLPAYNVVGLRETH